MNSFRVALDIERQVDIEAETPRDAVLKAAATAEPTDRLTRAVVANANATPNLSNFIVQEFDATNPAANSNYVRRCEVHPADDAKVNLTLFDAKGRIGVVTLTSRDPGLLALIAPQIAAQWRCGRLRA